MYKVNLQCRFVCTVCWWIWNFSLVLCMEEGGCCLRDLMGVLIVLPSRADSKDYRWQVTHYNALRGWVESSNNSGTTLWILMSMCSIVLHRAMSLLYCESWPFFMRGYPLFRITKKITICRISFLEILVDVEEKKWAENGSSFNFNFLFWIASAGTDGDGVWIFTTVPTTNELPAGIQTETTLIPRRRRHPRPAQDVAMVCSFLTNISGLPIFDISKVQVNVLLICNGKLIHNQEPMNPKTRESMNWYFC